MVMPGGIVLAGRPPLPWGRLGKGPTCYSLVPIINTGVSMNTLNTMMDDTFRINTNTHSALRVGGRLRRMIEVAFAAAIMFHEQRKDASEHRLSRVRLEAMVRRDMKAGDPCALICNWGSLVFKQHRLENVDLSSRNGESADAQVAAALRGMGETIGDLARAT